MEYLLLSLLIVIATVSYLNHRRDRKLLCSVSSPTRGTRAERKLIVKMLKKGVHPKAIFHDLYVKKKSGGYSQIDLVVATPQGVVISVWHVCRLCLQYNEGIESRKRIWRCGIYRQEGSDPCAS